MNKTIWLAVVVALLVGIFIGFVIERQRATDKMETAKLSMQKQFDEARMAIEKLMRENKKLQANKVTPTPSAMKK